MNLPTPRYFLIALLLIAVTVLASSCRHNDAQEQKEMETYKAFIKPQYGLFLTDDRRTNQLFKVRLDSFYRTCAAGNPYCMVCKYNTTGWYYNKMGMSDSSILYYDSTLHVFDEYKLKDQIPQDYINALTGKGKLLITTADLSQASYYLYMASQVARKADDSCGVKNFYYWLAMVAYKQEKYKESADYFKIAFTASKCETSSNLFQLQEDLDNIGLCFEQMQQPDSALYYYDSAIKYTQRHAEKYGPEQTNKALGVIYGNIGGVYMAKGLVDTAITLFKQSYDADVIYDKGDAVRTQLKLANAYNKKKDLPQMYATLQQVRKEMDTVTHSLDAEADWRQDMYHYYDQVGKQVEAFQYYRSYEQVRDSLWQLDKIQLQNDVSRELKDKQQLAEISVLQDKNKLSNMYLLITVTLMVMALAIVILIYVNFKRSWQRNKDLTSLNEQVSIQKQELENKNDEKDRILDIVAHDLRGPISGIFMLSDIMLDENTHTADDQESISMIKGASEGALSLITELLGYKDETRGVMSKQLADLVKLTDDTVKLLQLKAGEKQQKISVQLPSMPIIISMDKGKMNRVLTNLVSNAIKFSPAGATIDVDVVRRDGSVFMTVKDRGVGIPEKIQHSVFEMYTVAKRVGTAGEKSFGLGLAITKQIVEAHGGKIWFESVEGAGTTFYVELPQNAGFSA